MNAPMRRAITKLLADHALITSAIERAVRQAVLEHARAGRPVVASQDGEIVLVPPHEILARFGSVAEPEPKLPEERPALRDGFQSPS